MGVLAPLSIQKHAPGAGAGALSSARGFFGDLVQCSAHGVGWKSSTQDAFRCAVETSMHRRCLQSVGSSVRYQAKSLARFPLAMGTPLARHSRLFYSVSSLLALLPVSMWLGDA